MTDEEHELYERISEAVHALVDEMMKTAPAITELEVRQLLTEQFRFWKRV